MRMPSGSAVERALLCPPSTALPRIERHGEEADRGTELHKFLAAARKLGREAALEVIAKKYRPHAEMLDLEQLDIASFASEPAFAYDPETDECRLLGFDIGRAYLEHGWDPTREIACTPDGVGLSEDAALIVDWKSGVGAVTAVARNPQMKTGAICASRYYHRSKVLMLIAHIPEHAKKPWMEPAEITALDLDEWRQTLLAGKKRWAAAQEAWARGELPNVSAGAHCRYCPCAISCPAVGGAITRFRELSAGLSDGMGKPDKDHLADLKRQLTTALTPETARAARMLLVRHQAVLDLVDSALRDHAAQAPIPMDDEGRVWGPRTITLENLDPSVVFRVVREIAGEKLAERAVSWEASKTKIRDVARELAALQGGTIKGWEATILDTVRERGGVVEEPQERFTEYTPKEG
jgi:hypothetical protein